MRLLVAVIAAGASIGVFVSASALAPTLEITKIQCDPPPHPPGGFDLIEITNTGDEPQDLAGWQLRSDPEAGEQMALDVAGTLDAGKTLKIVAGYHAQEFPEYNVFLWSNIGVLREGEPMDYVKLFDASGAPVTDLGCDGQPLAAPTAAPTAAPATATPPPAGSAGTSAGTAGQTEAQVRSGTDGQTAAADGSAAQRTDAGGSASAAGGPASGVGSLAAGGAYPPGAIIWAFVALGLLGLIAGAALIRRGRRNAR